MEMQGCQKLEFPVPAAILLGTKLAYANFVHASIGTTADVGANSQLGSY
jgi:hypothetical protein